MKKTPRRCRPSLHCAAKSKSLRRARSAPSMTSDHVRPETDRRLRRTERCARLSSRRRPAIERNLALPMDATARRSTPRLIALIQSTRIAAYAGERRAIGLQWRQPRLLRLELPACLRLLASFARFVCSLRLPASFARFVCMLRLLASFARFMPSLHECLPV